MDRFLPNPFEDYKGQPIEIDRVRIRNLIKTYVKDIVENTRGVASRGDLYVGDAGIAYMFLRLCQTNELVYETTALQNSLFYVRRAMKNVRKRSRSSDEKCAFLCGNAGIYAVAAAISDMNQQHHIMEEELSHFEQGFNACTPIDYNENGGDEFLVGRAGYLAGVYWLNKTITLSPYESERIIEICNSLIRSGRQHAKATKSPFPLAYKYHSTDYLGAAHGLSSILHMLLQSPWYSSDEERAIRLHSEIGDAIKKTIDIFLTHQDKEGNFPCDMRDVYYGNGVNELVHWCHGGPGVIYLFMRAYRIYNETIYLDACEKICELIWRKGLLRKGPGLCHGVAGNGYAFLIMHRLTKDPKYLYRAMQFAYFLDDPRFSGYILKPDCPWSLYEGLAGTVCFLIDLMHNDNACFPFMDVF